MRVGAIFLSRRDNDEKWRDLANAKRRDLAIIWSEPKGSWAFNRALSDLPSRQFSRTMILPIQLT